MRSQISTSAIWNKLDNVAEETAVFRFGVRVHHVGMERWTGCETFYKGQLKIAQISEVSLS